MRRCSVVGATKDTSCTSTSFGCPLSISTWSGWPTACRRCAQIRAVHEGLLDEGQAATALALFDPLWQGLSPGEQARVLGLLVQRVDYDGARGRVAITFHPGGIKALADELAGREEGRSA